MDRHRRIPIAWLALLLLLSASPREALAQGASTRLNRLPEQLLTVSLSSSSSTRWSFLFDAAAPTTLLARAPILNLEWVGRKGYRLDSARGAIELQVLDLEAGCMIPRRVVETSCPATMDRFLAPAGLTIVGGDDAPLAYDGHYLHALLTNEHFPHPAPRSWVLSFALPAAAPSP